MTAADILAALGGAAGVGAAAKAVWEWYTARDRARLDAERAKVAAAAGERTDVIELLRGMVAKGEERGEKSAARADAMAEALRAVTEEMRSLGDSVDELRGVVTAHAHREEGALASLDGRLSLLTAPPATGEQPRASVVPDPPRLPALRPLTPAPPPRRQP